MPSSPATSAIDSIERCGPNRRIAAATIDLEKPETSISLPNTAPSRNTGKYSVRKPTILSMNRPVNIGATSAGSVSSTAPSAAIGANRITL